MTRWEFPGDNGIINPGSFSEYRKFIDRQRLPLIWRFISPLALRGQGARRPLWPPLLYVARENPQRDLVFP
jgi:hypothetical protein